MVGDLLGTPSQPRQVELLPPHTPHASTFFVLGKERVTSQSKCMESTAVTRTQLYCSNARLGRMCTDKQTHARTHTNTHTDTQTHKHTPIKHAITARAACVAAAAHTTHVNHSAAVGACEREEEERGLRL